MITPITAVLIYIAGLGTGIAVYHFVFKFGLKIGEAKRLDEDFAAVLDETKAVDQETTI